MTKVEFLRKLIDKKDSWQLDMPVFKDTLQLIEITTGSSYQGAFRIYIEGDVLFECYVESLKGLVKPQNPYVVSKKPYIEYKINTTGLKNNFIYEDRLSIYYMGGRTSIDIKFIVTTDKHEEIVIQSTDSVMIQKKSIKPETLSICTTKGTFHINESISIDILNETGRPRHLLFECDDEFITPKITEVYINNHWNQEWYIRKSMTDRLFGKLSFRNEPFKEVTIRGFIDNEFKPSYTIRTSITIYEPYETNNTISDFKTLKETKLFIFRHYIDGLVNSSSRKEATNIMDLTKACLNFNQKDLELRLFFIWLLTEYGHKKEAKEEMDQLTKYNDYYSTDRLSSMILLLERIIDKDINKSTTVFDSINEKSHWLAILAKARFTSSRNGRYGYYKALYDHGVRGSFLFAEVTSLLNQLPIIPEINDELYIATLRWAFNKKGVSSSWLNKLERHYYQLEKNPFMKSSLAEQLYEHRKSKNFLRLLCQLCINEDRYDKKAFDTYKESLASKIYIQDLDNHYIYGSWQGKEDINLDLLKHFTEIQNLAIPIREYIYMSVVKKRVTYGLLYRRLYMEILSYVKGTEVYSVEVIAIIASHIEDWIKEKNEIVFKFIKENAVEEFHSKKEGYVILTILLDFCLSDSCWLNTNKKTLFLIGIIQTLGFEGIYQLYHDDGIVMTMFTKLQYLFKDSEFNKDRVTMFLNNDVFFELYYQDTHLNLLFKYILVDEFLSLIENEYFALTIEEQQLVRNTVFYYASSRIVVGNEVVSDRLLKEMADYYVSTDERLVWLLLGLVLGLNDNNEDLTLRIRKIHKEAMKHDIIVPWFNDGLDTNNIEVIQYMTHPTNKVTIYYRYEEDEDFAHCQMIHLAFGVFAYRIKLFYDEFFEYYIIIEESDGLISTVYSEIIHSDQMSKHSLLMENEYSVEQRLDNIALSYELNDESSAIAFIEEQRNFESLVKKFTRI